MSERHIWSPLMVASVLALAPAAAEACAVCGLDRPGATPLAPLVFLMVMPFVVAGSMGAWLFYLHRRSQAGPTTAPAPRPNRTRRIEPAWHPILWGGLILLLVGVVIPGARFFLGRGTATRVGSSGGSPRLPVYSDVPPFSLLERSGWQVSRENLLGKVWIANFIFTSCRAICPRQTATMAQLQGTLGPEPHVRLVSITVHPEHDTPEVLARYAERFGADPLRWLFLTGEEKSIYALAQEGFRLSVTRVQADKGTPIERAFAAGGPATPDDRERSVSPAVSGDEARGALVHSGLFALVDRRARIRGYYSSLDPEAIARLGLDVRILLRERSMAAE